MLVMPMFDDESPADLRRSAPPAETDAEATAVHAAKAAAYWYAEGLPFACTGCGDCCTGAPGRVWVTPEEVAAIAQYLDKPLGEIRLFHTRPVPGGTSLTEFANGDCTFFDPQQRRCRIYPARPVQCRTWPFWNSNLATPEAWAATCESCRGAGVGPLVSLADIRAQADLRDL